MSLVTITTVDNNWHAGHIFITLLCTCPTWSLTTSIWLQISYLASSKGLQCTVLSYNILQTLSISHKALSLYLKKIFLHPPNKQSDFADQNDKPFNKAVSVCKTLGDSKLMTMYFMRHELTLLGLSTIINLEGVWRLWTENMKVWHTYVVRQHPTQCCWKFIYELFNP